MIRPHRLRTLHPRPVTEVDARRNLDRTLKHGIASHGGIRIDRPAAADQSVTADDGARADHPERVDTRPVGNQRVGANQAQTGSNPRTTREHG